MAGAAQEATTARAEQGLRAMIRTGWPITFRALAQTAGVSLDYPYRNQELRRRVEQLRRTPPAPISAPDPDQPSNVIRALTIQLGELERRHHEEITTLQHALAAAHGENLELRRRLGHRHEATE